ncbi:unnamed protein product, partial [Meganyctiphanes norvegica]
MSCAQVMYQPYAPNPYVVPQEAQASVTPSASSVATHSLPSGPPSAESVHAHEAALQQHHVSLTQPPTPQPHNYHHLQAASSTPHSSQSSSEAVGPPGGGGDGGGPRGALRP